jgi:hypothetical protein
VSLAPARPGASRSTPTTRLPTRAQALATFDADGRDRRQLCEAAGGNAQRSQPARDPRAAWVLWLPGPGQHRVRECLAHQASTSRASSAVTSTGAWSDSFAFSTI